MRYFGSQSCVFSDEPSRDEALLVLMDLRASPGGQSSIDEVSVHLAIRIHGRNGAVIGHQSGVTFFVEQAQVSIPEVMAVKAKHPKLIGEVKEGSPKVRDWVKSFFVRGINKLAERFVE